MPNALCRCSIALLPAPVHRRQTAADGGYASRANLAAAKARGIADVAFHKKCGIAITEMVKSPWVYRRLRNFRAGIEAAISCFKRAYGAARCTWRGLDHFKAYIWSAVVAQHVGTLHWPARYRRSEGRANLRVQVGALRLEPL